MNVIQLDFNSTQQLELHVINYLQSVLNKIIFYYFSLETGFNQLFLVTLAPDAFKEIFR